MPRDVWLVCAVLLINRAGTMVVPFLSLYLTRDRGLTVTAAGGFVALYGMGAIAGSYVGGWSSDRIGSERTQQISLTLAGLGFVGFSFLRGPLEIACALVLLGVINEAFRPAAFTATSERAPAGKVVKAFTLLRLAANVGMATGPAVAGFLAVHDYGWLFVGEALTCWAAAVFLWVFLERRPREPVTGHETVADSRSPWSDGPYLGLMLVVVVLAAVVFQAFSTLPLYLDHAYGLREGAIGALLALNAWLIIVFEMVLIHWAERREPLFLAGLGAFMVCLGLALMPFGSSIPYAAATVAVWTFGEMLSLPLLNAIVAGRAGRHNRGRYMGVYNMAFSVAFVLAPAAGTQVFDHAGPDRLWYGIGALGLPLWAATMALRTPLARRRTDG